MQAGIKIIVKGLVQGVGYRYFAYRLAAKYEIKGYVKNLFNGDVVIEAEGEKSLINEFIKDLKSGPMNARVNSVFAEELPVENKYDEFRIL